MAEKVGDIYVNISARLDDLEREFGKLDRTVKGQTSQLEKSLGSAFKRIGALAAGAFATDAIMKFTKEAIELAAVTEGVEAAFNKLNDPKLLDNLREATRGTVSDLKLMQAAVRANNFKIPLEQLGTYFDFAAKRASETGQSIDYIMNSILEGVSRGSIEVWDNMGFSLDRVRAKLDGVGIESLSVGQRAELMGELVDQELTNMGDVAVTAAQEMQNLQTELTNTKAAIGKDLLPVYRKWVEVQLEALNGIKNIGSSLSNLFNFSDWVAITDENLQSLERALGRSLTKTEEAEIRSRGFNEEQVKLIQSTEGLTQAQRDGIAAVAELAKERNAATEAAKNEVETISELEQALRDLENAQAPINIGSTRLAESFAEVDKKGTDAITGMLNYIPELQKIWTAEEVDEFVQKYTEGLKGITAEGQLLVDVMGMGLQQSFEAALINGESFTETLGQYFINLVQRILAAAAAAAVLAAILSATGLGGGVGFLGGFKSLFGGFSGLNIPGFGDSASIGGGSSLASPSGGGTVNVTGSISGNDIVLSNDRSNNTRGRTRGR